MSEWSASTSPLNFDNSLFDIIDQVRAVTVKMSTNTAMMQRIRIS